MAWGHQVELALGQKVKREAPFFGQPDNLGDLIRSPLLLDEDLLNPPRGAAEDLNDRVRRYADVGHPVDPGILVIGVLLDQGVKILAFLGPLENLLGQLLGFLASANHGGLGYGPFKGNQDVLDGHPVGLCKSGWTADPRGGGDEKNKKQNEKTAGEFHGCLLDWTYSILARLGFQQGSTFEGASLFPSFSPSSRNPPPFFI